MSVADPNHVVMTGENPFIRLSKTDSDDFTTNASFWRISGLVVRESIGNSIRLASAASFNTLDRLLVEQSHSAGLYATEAASHNILQNSVSLPRWLKKAANNINGTPSPTA